MERKLGLEEKPLLVQLNWHIDDREGRFLLRRIDDKTNAQGVGFAEASSFRRKLSKREKKQMKKQEKLGRLKSAGEQDENAAPVDQNGVAEKLYTGESPQAEASRSLCGRSSRLAAFCPARVYIYIARKIEKRPIDLARSLPAVLITPPREIPRETAKMDDAVCHGYARKNARGRPTKGAVEPSRSAKLQRAQQAYSVRNRALNDIVKFRLRAASRRTQAHVIFTSPEFSS